MHYCRSPPSCLVIVSCALMPGCGCRSLAVFFQEFVSAMVSNSVMFHSAFEIVDFVETEVNDNDKAVATMPVIDVWKNTLMIRQGSSILETTTGRELVLFERSFQAGFTATDVIALMDERETRWLAGVPLRIPGKGYEFEYEKDWKTKEIKYDRESGLPLRRYTGHWEPGIVIQACEEHVALWGLDYCELREYEYTDKGYRKSLLPEARHEGVIAITLQAWNFALGTLDDIELVSARPESEVKDAGNYFENVAWVRTNGPVLLPNKYNPADAELPSFPQGETLAERMEQEEAELEAKRSEFRSSSALGGFTLRKGEDKTRTKKAVPGATKDLINNLKSGKRNGRKLMQ